MDRNTLSALLLLGLLMIFWSYYLGQDEPNKQNTNSTTQKQVLPSNSQDTLSTIPSDSAQQKLLADRFGKFAPVATGENRSIRIETDLMQVTLQTKGAAPSEVLLTKHFTWDKKPLPIHTKDERNRFTLQFSHQNRVIETGNLYFQPSDTGLITV
ncbi:MAG: hypothetical protein NZ108_07705, partial [Bacteroidia bacterium]|nr:hypothetical protein [Bacteroidia bacterium]